LNLVLNQRLLLVRLSSVSMAVISEVPAESSNLTDT
jgi:hypothetical protein